MLNPVFALAIAKISENETEIFRDMAARLRKEGQILTRQNLAIGYQVAKSLHKDTSVS
jgi:hypothetical protein